MCARGMLYNASSNSAEHHRVTPEPAVGPAFGSIVLCARSGLSAAKPGMDVSSFSIVPGFHFVQPGQQIKRKQNAARRMSSDDPRHSGAARADRSALA